MKRNDALAIGDLVREALREQGLETPLNEYRLIEAWPRVLGSTIAGYTQNLYIRNQVLYVQLSSSVLRQELMMNRRRLVERLNREVGAQVITDVVLR